MSSIKSDPKALAALAGGPDAWRVWANASKLGEFDFSGIAFPPTATHSFDDYRFAVPVICDGASFPDGFSFYNCKFQKRVSFYKASFGDRVSFSGCSFDGDVSFDEGTFHGSARFSQMQGHPGSVLHAVGCNYLGEVRLDESTFEKVDFTKAIFRQNAACIGAIFKNNADFGGALFSAQANFTATQFQGNATFSGTRFKQEGIFTKAAFGNLALFDRATFDGEAGFFGATIVGGTFSHVAFHGSATFSAPVKTPLGSLDFTNAVFNGKADFGNREFTQSTIFQDARFSRPPSFHNSELHHDTVFDGTEFGSVEASDAERCFRTLKLAMSQHQAYSEELQFFALELKARRKRARGIVRWLHTTYETLSDYGRSVGRPTIALGIATLAALLVYSLASYLWLSKDCRAAEGCRLIFDAGQLSRLVSYALASAFPFFRDPIGVYWSVLPSDGVLSLVVRIVTFLQALFSLCMLFLIGLGLRNFFRLK